MSVCGWTSSLDCLIWASNKGWVQSFSWTMCVSALQSMQGGADDIHEGSFYTIAELDIRVGSTQFFCCPLRQGQLARFPRCRRGLLRLLLQILQTWRQRKRCNLKSSRRFCLPLIWNAFSSSKTVKIGVEILLRLISSWRCSTYG